MTTETIFSDGNQPAQQTTIPPATPAAPAAPTIPQELVEFVGEGKKYKSVEDALKSVPHAQTHIQTLEERLAAMEAELAKRKAAEELLEDIKQGVQQPGNTTPTVDLNPDKVSEIVLRTLQQEKVREVQEGNIKSVVSTFLGAFGDKAKAEQEYNKLAMDNGLSVDQMNNLAATSPEVVLKLAGLKKQAAPVGRTTSSLNTQALNLTSTPEPQSLKAKTLNTRDVQASWDACKARVQSQNQS